MTLGKGASSLLRGLSRLISSTKKLGKEDLFNNPFARDFGKFDKITKPGNVSLSPRVIPPNIETPGYYATGHPPLTLTQPPIEIKGPKEVEGLRAACRLAAEVLAAAAEQARPGVTTQELDDFVFSLTISKGAFPSPLNYRGFPKAVCTSVNNVACHGIPDDRPLRSGDVVNIDVMVFLGGWHGDCSKTVLVGDVDEEGKRLVEVAEKCMNEGILVCGPDVPFESIGRRIEEVAEEEGYGVVPCFTGHGIGKQIHMPPDIYHIDYPYPGKMQPGMTFTVEPVITQGGEDVVILEDGWTAVTLDGARTAQFEHTVLITPNGVELLTKL